MRPSLPIFLFTSDVEVEQKCEGTLRDAYSLRRASNYLQSRARSRKSPNFSGAFLFASSKRWRLEARNFAVILIFSPFTTYEFYECLFGPEKFSGLSKNGPMDIAYLDLQSLANVLLFLDFPANKKLSAVLNQVRHLMTLT